MQFSKKNMAIIALLVILAASNVAFALLYMTKNVNITGGVSVVGAIEIYQEDGVTPLTSYDFPLFTGGVSDYEYLDFFVNNTGNQPVYVFWNISTSSITWEISGLFDYYYHREGALDKYLIFLYYLGTSTKWYPYRSGAAPEEALYLGVGEGQAFRLDLTYPGYVNTPGTFTLVMSFYAKDSPP